MTPFDNYILNTYYRFVSVTHILNDVLKNCAYSKLSIKKSPFCWRAINLTVFITYKKKIIHKK